VGIFAAYRGGRTDALLMRVVDLQLGFPVFLLAVILLAVLGRGVDKVVIAIVAAQWARYARTARGAALVEMRKEYIEAARCLGLSSWAIVRTQLLRNCLPPVLVVATVEVAFAIALEATLSFLGLGLPVTEPSLGLLIANGFQQMLAGKYWLSVFPGIALLLAVASLNLIGDRLRDVFDPRS
jgi:peptide/nickel transport system permease protein